MNYIPLFSFRAKFLKVDEIGAEGLREGVSLAYTASGFFACIKDVLIHERERERERFGAELYEVFNESSAFGSTSGRIRRFEEKCSFYIFREGVGEFVVVCIRRWKLGPMFELYFRNV